MFASRFFNLRYWAERFWPKGASAAPPAGPKTNVTYLATLTGPQSAIGTLTGPQSALAGITGYVTYRATIVDFITNRATLTPPE